MLPILSDNCFTALHLGPQLLGWVGPCGDDGAREGDEAEIFIVSGGRTVPVPYSYLRDAEGYHYEDCLLPRFELMCRRFVVIVPDNLRIEDRIFYSGVQTLNTVFAAVSQMMTVMMHTIQAQFHNLPSHEVAEGLLELDLLEYSVTLSNALTWRGKSLSGALDKSSLYSILVSPQSMPLTVAPQRVLALVTVARRQGDNPHQSRFVHGSQSELAEANHILRNPAALSRIFNPSYTMYVFYGPTDDPLAEWLKGERISVAELMQKHQELEDSGKEV